MSGRLFQLRFTLAGKLVVITAWEAAYEYSATGHQKIDAELRYDGRTVFHRGDTWCAVAAGTTLDGNAARQLVGSLFAMRPGDTDADYFARYTEVQLDFANRYGEHLALQVSDRYCDQSGNVVDR